MARISTAIKGTSIRSLDGHPLSKEQLLVTVPSLFADSKHESRSERFQALSTWDIVQGLRTEGFMPVFAVQSKARDLTKHEFTKHMIRLRHIDALDVPNSNEIILVNANDGTSSYRMMSGKFRFVCQNGLVMGDVQNDFRIYHKGTRILDEAKDGALAVMNNFVEYDRYEKEMSKFILDKKQRASLAFASIASIIEDPEEILNLNYNYTDLLKPRRVEDNKPDLWSTFNVIQENMIKGGLSGTNENGRRTKTREIRNIDRNIFINRSLWNVAKTYVDETATIEV